MLHFSIEGIPFTVDDYGGGERLLKRKDYENQNRSKTWKLQDNIFPID